MLGCDRKSRQSDTGEHRFDLFWGGQAFDAAGAKIHHKPDRRHGFIIQPPDAKPANFDLAGNSSGWPNQHTAVQHFQMEPVIADEPSEAQRVGRR